MWELYTWDMLPETLLKVLPSMWVPLKAKAMAKVADEGKERASGEAVLKLS
jgi:hypothetical protein